MCDHIPFCIYTNRTSVRASVSEFYFVLYYNVNVNRMDSYMGGPI